MAGRTAASITSVAPDMTWFLIANAVTGVLTSIAGLAAIAWFGMWMGLTNRKTSLAVLKTVCYVLVLPWIALMFARIFITIGMIPFGIRGNPTLMEVFSTLIIAVLALGKDGFLSGGQAAGFTSTFANRSPGDRTPAPACLVPCHNRHNRRRNFAARHPARRQCILTAEPIKCPSFPPARRAPFLCGWGAVMFAFLRPRSYDVTKQKQLR